jgi:hypothetical protein
MGTDAVLDHTVTHFSPAGLRLSTAVLDAVGRAASCAVSILGAQAACGFVGAVVMVNDFDDRAACPLADGEVLQTGKHRIRFLSMPHVPHSCDAGLFFDETERTLLCSDLFFQPGDPELLIESGIVERAREAIHGALNGPLAKDMPYTPYTDSTLQRLAALKPKPSQRCTGRHSVVMAEKRFSAWPMSSRTLWATPRQILDAC